MPRSSTSRIVAFVLAGLAVLVGGAVYLLRTPSDDYVLNPDHANLTDKVLTVAGETPVRGKHQAGIYYLDVLVHRASLAESWLARLERGSTVVPAQAILPPGGEKQDHQLDHLAIEQSKQVAAYVALKALGDPVKLESRGVYIDGVTARARAAGVRRGMLIRQVAGQQTPNVTELARVMQGQKPGDRVAIGVRDGAHDRVLQITLGGDDSNPKRALIGVQVTDVAPKLQLSRRISYRTAGLGGPSAGLAFALEIYDALKGRSLSHGRRVAVTGTIAVDGAVGPIGGMKQKAIGARETGVDLLLVPKDNAAEARRYAGDVPVVAVTSFTDALGVLRRTAT